jgi:hypothetical protein
MLEVRFEPHIRTVTRLLSPLGSAAAFLRRSEETDSEGEFSEKINKLENFPLAATFSTKRSR